MTVPRSIDLYHVLVPLKKPIRHASFARTDSDNFVVRVTLSDGTQGFGEGVPRSYVTGETIESAFASLEGLDLPRLIGHPADFGEVVRRLAELTLPETESDPRGMAGNSARCALELALLDAYGRKFGVSVGQAVRMVEMRPEWLTTRPEPVRYSGAITAESPKGEKISAWKMRIYGFHQVKVKVGVEGQDDPARLARIRRSLGPRKDIRIDANEAWSADEVLSRVEPLRPALPSVLEQPVPHAQVEALAEIRPKLGHLRIMLDESLCGYPDALHAVEHRTTDLFNVRLSKCGGILPSLRIMALAHRSGLGIQLGCHPGETGLLSAAGRQVASNVRGLAYVEGSYDRHVLAANLILEDITFGYGGRARPLPGAGLGVTVDPEALRRMTVRHREVRHD
ncbi:dipeptide epimerase [Tundrisphaera lichenicola]|uniref:dipeptide epimerase n=1 Tax=Tundrisphaera lichenicola TaxID=2029860 RepID=UPI003EBE82FD